MTLNTEKFVRGYQMESIERFEAIEISDIDQLKQRLEEQNLLEPTPWFYARHAAVALALYTMGVVFLIAYEGFWWQMANAALLAFAFVLLGFLMHYVGHNQVTEDVRWLRPIGMLFNILIGLSMWWWIQKHLAHHKDPNGKSDPDFVGIRFFGLTEEQVLEKKGLYRLTTQYQHILFIPFIFFGQLWHLRYAAVKFLLKQRSTRAKMDLCFMALHMVLYLGALFLSRSPMDALAFVVAHAGFTGLWLGIAFAVNHIGRPTELSADTGYLPRQVITARNIRIHIRRSERATLWANRVLTFLMGGLNFQTEHHLFPKTLRHPNLYAASLIVEAFCKEREVEYYSVGFRSAFWQVLAHLYKMSQHARPNRVPQGSEDSNA